MSVAFRRESDEEHLEPKFELPIPAGPNRVTARGLALIGARIAELEAELAAETARAQEPDRGDPEAAKRLQRDLRYWTTRQITAELAPVPSGDKVEFGTEVRVRLNGTPRTFRIVGDDEADPAAGLLSFNAPLSRAMLGAEVGDVLAFGGREEAIEVVGIGVMGASRGEAGARLSQRPARRRGAAVPALSEADGVRADERGGRR